METAVWILLGVIIVFIIVIFGMGMKIYLLQKSAGEISEQFEEILDEDTNLCICISSRDRHIRKLADNINIQLKKFRSESLRFQKGDTELKTAVTNISHDLRTPLTSICGYLDLLESEETSENAQRYLSVIRNRADNMKQLTEELFKYSLDISEKELVFEDVNICSVLEQSLLSFYGVFTNRGITPEIDIPKTPIICHVDKSALNRIFSNIIHNAVKYSDGDFVVSINKTGEMIFSNRAEKMDTVSAGKLFDRFFTVEANRNSTGLGLSIAKYLTEAMNGSISAEYQNQRFSVKLVIKTVR